MCTEDMCQYDCINTNSNATLPLQIKTDVLRHKSRTSSYSFLPPKGLFYRVKWNRVNINLPQLPCVMLSSLRPRITLETRQNRFYGTRRPQRT